MDVRFQDHMIAVTKEAMEEAFRYAKGVPEDKIRWEPLDAGRNVLDMVRELAKCADWAYDALDGKGMELEAGDTGFDETSTWNSIAECEAAAQEKLTRYFSFIAGYPDTKLSETVNLPFGQGESMRTFTMAEMMDYPRWNANYHQGQIAYIQTLYGDKGNH